MNRYLLLFLLAVPAFSQPPVRLHPPESTVASFPTCDGSYAGSRIRLATDGASASDCVTGAASTDVLCWCDGVGPWAQLGGGSVGGSTTEFLYNNGGVEDGTSYFTTDGTDLTISSGDLGISAGSLTVADGTGDAFTVASDATSNAVTALGSVGQVGAIFTVQENGGDTLTLTHDGTDGTIASSAGDITITSAGGEVNVGAAMVNFSDANGIKIGTQGNLIFEAGSTLARLRNMTVSGTPQLQFQDSTGSSRILSNCPTTNDCDFDIDLYSGAVAWTTVMRFDTTDAGVTSLIVQPDGSTAAITVSEADNITLLTVPHGEMYEDNGSGSTITVTTAGTYYGWQTATAGEVAGVTTDVADAASDHFIIGTGMGGAFSISFSMSYSAPNNAVTSCFLHDSAVITPIGFRRTMGAAAAIGSASANGIYAAAAADELNIRCTSDTNSDAIVVYNVGFVIHRVGA